MTKNWIAVLGSYSLKEDEIEFIGGKFTNSNSVEVGEIANFICDETFSGGKITAEITFQGVEPPTACEFILYWEPDSKHFVTAGIGGAGALTSVRTFASTWTNHSLMGSQMKLEANRPYNLEVDLVGSKVTVKLDGITTTIVNLPYNFGISQVGLWCQGDKNIVIKNFTVYKERPKAFVVMQFSSPYNELYEDVIKEVCKEFKLQVLRGDETYGPGIILSDITNKINESKIIIAEISPANPNVFYEVGYAHALNKPTILIADKSTKLPFDVSPFRTLFYEDSIAGKKKIEEGLRQHIAAILSEKGLL